MRYLSLVAALMLMIFSSQAFCQILEIHHIDKEERDLMESIEHSGRPRTSPIRS